MKNLVWITVAALLPLGAAPPASSQPVPQPSAAMALTDAQRAVWQGEEDYWKYVNGRDMKGYLAQWHPDFRGWPCNTDHPADVAGLARWAADWFAAKTKAGESTTPQVEAVVVDKDFAITYLSARTTWTAPDGTKQSRWEKFVHTWKATDHGWKIIGGMCAPLDRSETSGSERGK